MELAQKQTQYCNSKYPDTYYKRVERMVAYNPQA